MTSRDTLPQSLTYARVTILLYFRWASGNPSGPPPSLTLVNLDGEMLEWDRCVILLVSCELDAFLQNPLGKVYVHRKFCCLVVRAYRRTVIMPRSIVVHKGA